MQALRYCNASAQRTAALMRPASMLAARAYSSAQGSLTSSKLGNGVTLVSDNSASPLAAISVSVKAGSAVETHENNGASHFLKYMALKSTKSTSALRVTRLVEAHTANFAAESNRESISYTATCPQAEVPHVLEILSDMLAPRLHEYEVRDQRELVAADAAKRSGVTSERLEDLVHTSVFRGQGLGRSPVVPAFNQKAINHELLEEFVAQNYVGENVTVVGLGVDSAQFTEAAQSFGKLAQSTAGSSVVSSTNFGGEIFEAANGGSRVALAYSAGKHDAATLHVLYAVLGGYLKQNRTTVGLGVTSRLYQNVLKNHPEINTASALFVQNSVQPFVGVTAFSSGAGNAGTMADALKAEVQSLGSITDDDVKRAIATTTMHIHDMAENKTATAHYLATHRLSSSPADMVADIKKVTAADVKAAAKEIFAGKATLAAVGDLTGL